MQTTYLSAHDSNFGGWPRVVDVASHVFRVHNTVRTAISLARDHRNLWNSRLRVREDQLCPVTDYAVVFLVRSCTSSYRDSDF